MQGDMGDQALVERVIAEHGIDAIAHFAAKIVVPEFGRRSARLLSQQYREVARPARERGAAAACKHFIFSSTAAVYGEPAISPVPRRSAACADQPLWPLQADDRVDAARTSRGAHDSPLRRRCAISTSPAPTRRAAPASRRPNATHLIKVAARRRSGQRAGLEVFGTDYPTPDGTCVRDYIHVTDLARAHLAALDHLRNGGESLTLNCGYGRGYSVNEVVDVVKQVSGVDFPVKLSGRRAGDPAALVAKADRIREKLGWQPEYDDLETIVGQALKWEDKLARRNAR